MMKNLLDEGQHILYDKIINLTLGADGDSATVQVFNIECPDTGMKPDITLSYSLLEGGICYKIVVRIKNLNVQIDTSKFTRMIIVAGYKGINNGDTVTFQAPIMRSYRESPNPDGATVIEGITVGSQDNTLRRGSILVNFNEESVTVANLISKCCLGAGVKVKHIKLPSGILNSTIPTQVKSYVAASGYALLNWLQDRLYTLIKNTYNKHVKMAILSDGVSIFTLEDVDEDETLAENILNLDLVTSASFSNGSLTVEAPWVPTLQPGDLFYMPPNYLNGTVYLNSVASADYRDENNLYRIIQLSIEFSTVENRNKMVLMAMSSKYIKNTWEREDIISDVKKIQAFAAEYEPADIGEQVINFGEPLVSETPQSMWDLDASSLATGGTVYTIQKGDTLSKISERWYAGKKAYVKTPKELGDRQKYIVSSDKTQNTPYGGAYWWPLIAIATNYYVQQAKKDGKATEYVMDITNPNNIYPGKLLYLPTVNSLDDVTQYKDAFLDITNIYKDNTEYQDVFKNIYVYMGGSL